MTMQMLTLSTQNADEELAVTELKQKLTEKNSVMPNFLLIYFAESYDVRKLQLAFIKNFPEIPFTAVVTAEGGFSDDTVLGFEDEKRPTSPSHKSRFSVYRLEENSAKKQHKSIFITAFYDPFAKFGNAIVRVNDNNDLKVLENLHHAAHQADKSGIMPDLFSLYTFNVNVNVLGKDIENVLGDSVPVFGGMIESSDTDAGVKKPLGKAFTHEDYVHNDSFYVITLMYLTCQVRVESHSNCIKCPQHAAVTGGSINSIDELDHQPAADLFFRWLNKDSIDLSVSEMRKELKKQNTRYFVGKQTNSIYGEITHNVSFIREITNNRGLMTNVSWPLNDEINLMYNSNDDLFRNFKVRCVEPTRNTIGFIHQMCVSFCQGERKDSFINVIVNNVRNLHQNEPFVVSAMNGEFGKDIESGLVLGNYTVSTVYFFD